MGSLTVTGLGKAYKQYDSRWGRLAEWLLPGHSPRHRLKWVLHDISFAVAPGESVGIVGINGAGKSTLLKLITGTVQPTTGTVSVHGRVAALLELGMGFHPDFTGRQNAVMAGQLLGYSAQDMHRLMPEIEAFAEIGDYIDQPVRVYSSGMQVRLAFSVATALRPDILIVDEALSVGDAYFQHKCFERTRQFKEAGTTLLFVSHDPGTVKSLCQRAILIADGRIVRDGVPSDVLDYYNALIVPDAAQRALQELPKDSESGLRSGDGRLRIEQAQWEVGGRPVLALTAGEPVDLCLRVRAEADVADFTIGLQVKDRLGNTIFGTNTFHMHTPPAPVRAGSIHRYRFSIPALTLGPSHYTLTLAVHASHNHLAGNYDWWERAITFQVLPAAGCGAIGVCHMPVDLVSAEECP